MGRCQIVLPLLGFVVLSGCGFKAEPPPKTYPVHGKLVLASGDPLTVGTVEIVPVRQGEGFTAGGTLSKDGSFTLKAFGTTQGTTPGKYLMAIHGYSRAEHGPIKGKPPTFPEKYKDPSTSEIIVEVKSQDNDLGTIVLKD